MADLKDEDDNEEGAEKGASQVELRRYEARSEFHEGQHARTHHVALAHG